MIAILVLCAAIVAGVRYGTPAAGHSLDTSGATGAAATTARATAGTGPTRIDVPAGVTAGVAVFDRRTGVFTEQLDANKRFRSASVVKLLIALDYLWSLGPEYRIPAADRPAFDRMLRSSDDAAASDFWSRAGADAVVDRMVTRLSLVDTAPPDDPNYWGYTAHSAADVVRIYRYLLETAPAPVRDLVMGDLRASTRCASDSFDQHFGIPSAFDRPWAVKQGWSGFSSGGCGPTGAVPASAGVDLSHPALHTTGTVGAADRSIVVVLTLHPAGTSYGRAYTDVGRLTRSLNVPGAALPSGTRCSGHDPPGWRRTIRNGGCAPKGEWWCRGLRGTTIRRVTGPPRRAGGAGPEGADEPPGPAALVDVSLTLRFRTAPCREPAEAGAGPACPDPGLQYSMILRDVPDRRFPRQGALSAVPGGLRPARRRGRGRWRAGAAGSV
ncbi:hypothetical protein ACFXMF_17225 [Embleya sp. NPDC059213]